MYNIAHRRRLGPADIGVDSGGAARARAPQQLRWGANSLFAPQNQTRMFYFVILKKKTWKKAETETKKEKYKEKGVNFEWREGCFLKKVVDD